MNKAKKLTVSDIEKMSYVDLMATLDEINRPPGGKESIRELVINTFLGSESEVLDVGCNTGYCSFEIASLAKCKVVGLDINKNMIKSATSLRDQYYPNLKNKISFLQGDGEKLPFEDNSFDLVMSGGSTAFIPDIQKALNEYKRVCRPWGFIGDINFYYHTDPPKKMLNKLNKLLGIQIQPWNKEYWLNIYRKADLEIYHTTYSVAEAVSDKKIKDYCSYLAIQKGWSKGVTDAAITRLIETMGLFNENHNYLAFGVFVLRKRTFPEVTLF